MAKLFKRQQKHLSVFFAGVKKTIFSIKKYYNFFNTVFIFFILVSSISAQTAEETQFNQELQQYLNEAKKAEKEGDLVKNAAFLNKAAFLLWKYSKIERAIEYFEESLELNIKIGNNKAIEEIHNNLGLLFFDNEDYENSLKNFGKTLEMRKKRNAPDDMAQTYNNIAIVYQGKMEYQKAVETLLQGLELAKETKNMKLLKSCYGMLAENYDYLGNSKKSMEYYDKFLSINKHIRNKEFEKKEKERKEKITNLEEKTKNVEKEKQQTTQELKETQKDLEKEKELTGKQKMEIELLNKDKKLKELTITQHKKQLEYEKKLRIVLISGISLLLIFLLIIFYLFKKKKKMNILLKNKNDQLIKQSQKIEKQKDQIDEGKKKVEKKNRQILDSIEYASRIQNAILPGQQVLKGKLREYFIIFMPRDIVSGDFYWFHNTPDNKTIIAVADCTGHGVPGAIMSMIGNILLNQIIKEKHIYNTSEILHQLNQGVNNVLNQFGGNHENIPEDGMDISICCLDKINETVEITSAIQRVFIVRNGKLELIEGDVYTIGMNYIDMKYVRYTNHKFNMKDVSMVYLLTDGFEDQFGGEENQKFMVKKLIDKLKNIIHLDLEEQKKELEHTYLAWKRNNIQVDDVLFIGFKI